MAATRLIALHVNKGKSVAQCLADRTDYSQNAAKTNNGEFISCGRVRSAEGVSPHREAAARTRKLKVQNADPLHFALSHFHDNLRQ